MQAAPLWAARLLPKRAVFYLLWILHKNPSQKPQSFGSNYFPKTLDKHHYLWYTMCVI